MIRVLPLVLLACAGPSSESSSPRGGTAAGTETCVRSEPGPPPHVVVLVLDDVGWTGVSTGRTNLGHGSDYHQTPRLDALAEGSVSYSAAYSSPQCQPARAALLTGLHAAHTGVYTNYDSNRAPPSLRRFDAPPNEGHLSPESVTLAEMLGPQGWRTGHFGKWHIGTPGVGGPLRQGFEVNLGGTEEGAVSGGFDGHISQANGSFSLPGLGPNGVGGQFMADRLTAEAIAWLQTDLSRPGFALVSHFSVHTPIQSPASDLALFDGQPPGTYHHEPIYAGMLHNLDATVGTLVDWLETTDDPRTECDKLIDNTLLVVLSDNGGTGGYAGEGVEVQREITNQLPLRSGKGTAWEGGMRVPLVVRWERGGAAGRIIDQPVQHVDVVPTVLELAGLEGPPGLDGTSLGPLLTPEGVLPREAVFFHYPAYLDFLEAGVDDRLRETPTSAAWDGRYKLIWRYETEAWELYDLDADLAESTNVAGSHPDVVARLGQALIDWLVTTDAALPVEKGTSIEVGLPSLQAAP